MERPRQHRRIFKKIKSPLSPLGPTLGRKVRVVFKYNGRTESQIFDYDEIHNGSTIKKGFKSEHQSQSFTSFNFFRNPAEFLYPSDSNSSESQESTGKKISENSNFLL